MAILGGAIGFCIGVKLYFNAEHEKTMESFTQYIKKRKVDAQKRRLSRAFQQETNADNEQNKSESQASMWARVKKMLENENDKKINEIKQELESDDAD